MRLLAAAFFLATGCVAEVKIDVDGDGDGLLDSVEAEIGTDPGKTDSDGDEYADGEEVDGNTDPTNPDDKPYALGWQIDDCRNDLEGTGTEPGNVADNYTWGDQLGETVKLHDFCNQVVMVVGAGFT